MILKRILARVSTKRKSRPVPSKTEQEVDLDTPEGVYTYLDNLRARNRSLSVQVTLIGLLGQVDELRTAQVGVEELFRISHITKFGEIRKLLQDAERALCMHGMKQLISDYVLGGEELLLAYAPKVTIEGYRLVEQTKETLIEVLKYTNEEGSLDDVKEKVRELDASIKEMMKVE
ncbi:hypothetical protein IJ118_01785 [Candidatus Saccharibacteria bacterium]|nr:hypothetical protein [Candidatus Saccharibacteria bacterium]